MFSDLRFKMLMYNPWIIILSHGLVLDDIWFLLFFIIFVVSPLFLVIDEAEIVYRDYIDISVAVATPKVRIGYIASCETRSPGLAKSYYPVVSIRVLVVFCQGFNGLFSPAIQILFLYLLLLYFFFHFLKQSSSVPVLNCWHKWCLNISLA